MIKAILFDMDGVLIDARDWHYEALNTALNHFGHHISRDSHLSTFDGLPTRVKLDLLTKTRDLPVGLHELINSLKQKYTLRLSHLRCSPTFIHRYALSRLSFDYKISVCSNSIRPTVNTLMRLSGLDSYLDLVVSSDDVIHPKPSPDMYLYAMKHFSLIPENCLIIEDNDHGIQAATASGAHVMRVSSPIDVTYDRIISKINQISSF